MSWRPMQNAAGQAWDLGGFKNRYMKGIYGKRYKSNLGGLKITVLVGMSY